MSLSVGKVLINEMHYYHSNFSRHYLIVLFDMNEKNTNNMDRSQTWKTHPFVTVRFTINHGVRNKIIRLSLHVIQRSICNIIQYADIIKRQ